MTLVGAIACKVPHNLSSCNSPRARKLLLSLLMTLVDGQHIRQSFLVTCINNSYYEILAALQTEKAVVRTQKYSLDADKFPVLSVCWTWQEFCRDLDLCWSEKRVATMM